MRIGVLVLVGLVLAAPQGFAAPPRVFELDAQKLVAAKAKASPVLIARVRAEADQALGFAPVSVMDKTVAPIGGDKHDFMTMGAYWWPNPATGDHLPYVRRDGYHNPESDLISDERNLNHMLKAARALALGYYITGEERYANHAARLLRVWFLDPATAMKPSLNFVGFVPGRNTGRDAGIVNTRNMPLALDTVGLLAGAQAWTAADAAGMTAWFEAYDHWLETSRAGLKQSTRPNNHGSWYAVQVTALALYLGRPDDARRVLEQVRGRRIPSQIDAQGMQRYEMERTKSFSYSAMNLHALTTLADMAAPLGLDLYAPRPGVLTAIDALLPFDPRHPWPHQQVEPNREDSLCPALVAAAAHTGEAKYFGALGRFDCLLTAADLIALGRF